jgi:hypothetical protein
LTFDESKQAFPQDYYALVNRSVHHVITQGESYRHLLRRATKRFKRDSAHTPRRENRGFFAHRRDLFSHSLLLGAINRRTKTTPWLVTSNCGITALKFAVATTFALSRSTTRVISRKLPGNDSFGAR